MANLTPVFFFFFAVVVTVRGNDLTETTRVRVVGFYEKGRYL